MADEAKGKWTTVSTTHAGAAAADRLSKRIKGLKKTELLESIFLWLERHPGVFLAACGAIPEEMMRQILEIVVNEMRRREGLPPCDPSNVPLSLFGPAITGDAPQAVYGVIEGGELSEHPVPKKSPATEPPSEPAPKRKRRGH